jgi:hypothetical protein
MTPEQKLKHLVLLSAFKMSREDVPQSITKESIDDLYRLMSARDDVKAAADIIREGVVDTSLPCSPDSGLESFSVGAQAPDGTWIGWTYWCGESKFGDPAALPWMSKAYDLDCTEAEKLVIVRTFKTRPAEGGAVKLCQKTD